MFHNHYFTFTMPAVITEFSETLLLIHWFILWN